MRTYLVDTNVLSASAPTKSLAPSGLLSWMDRHGERLRLSVITVAEVEEGIAKSRRQGATRKAERLAEWLEATLHLYAARILSLDLEIARHLGGLMDQARGQGLGPGLADLAIAATAKRHGCIMLTRNLKHFTPLGVPAIDPFSELPQDD